MNPALFAKFGIAGAAIGAILYLAVHMLDMQEKRAADDRQYHLVLILQALNDAETACKVPEHKRTAPPERSQ